MFTFNATKQFTDWLFCLFTNETHYWHNLKKGKKVVRFPYLKTESWPSQANVNLVFAMPCLCLASKCLLHCSVSRWNRLCDSPNKDVLDWRNVSISNVFETERTWSYIVFRLLLFSVWMWMVEVLLLSLLMCMLLEACDGAFEKIWCWVTERSHWLSLRQRYQKIIAFFFFFFFNKHVLFSLFVEQ